MRFPTGIFALWLLLFGLLVWLLLAPDAGREDLRATDGPGAADGEDLRGVDPVAGDGKAGPSLRTRTPAKAPPPTDAEAAAAARPTRVLRVVTKRGHPVRDAAIAWWREPPPGVYRGHRAQQIDRRPADSTDREGRCALPEDAPRGCHVGVSAPGYIRFEGRYEAGEDGEMLVVLRRTLRVSGTIHDDRGKAVRLASISLYDARPHDVQRATFHARPGFLPPGVRATVPLDEQIAWTKPDTSGAWERDVREGRVRVVVELQGGMVFEKHVDVRPGAENHWALRLSSDQCLHTRVDPPPGAAGIAFKVELYAADANGRLDVEDGFCTNDWAEVDDRPVDLELPPPDTPFWLVVFPEQSGLPCHVVGPLRGPQPNLVIELPEDCHRRGRIRGRLADGGHEPQRYVFVSDVHGFLIPAAWDGGTFTAENVPPGTYRVRVESDTDEVLWSREDVRVAPGETVDLGTLQPRAPRPDDEDDEEEDD